MHHASLDADQRFYRQFVLLAGTTIGLLAFISAAVGLLVGMGSDELPGVSLVVLHRLSATSGRRVDREDDCL